MTNKENRSCYDCSNFSLCRLRDRASELSNYFSMTGNLMGSDFANELYELMGANCPEYKKELEK